MNELIASMATPFDANYPLIITSHWFCEVKRRQKITVKRQQPRFVVRIFFQNNNSTFFAWNHCFSTSLFIWGCTNWTSFFSFEFMDLSKYWINFHQPPKCTNSLFVLVSLLFSFFLLVRSLRYNFIGVTLSFNIVN